MVAFVLFCYPESLARDPVHVSSPHPGAVSFDASLALFLVNLPYNSVLSQFLRCFFHCQADACASAFLFVKVRFLVPTTQQKLQTLRDTYSQQAQMLRLLRASPTEREERQNYGQHCCLDYVVHALRFLDEGELTPRQVQAQIEPVLTTLADWKVEYLIDHIREREHCGWSVLAEWMAEGAIKQFDQIFPALLATFPPQWKKCPRIYGHFFQLYHHRDHWEWSVEQAAACWQTPDQRAQEFEEIGFLRLDMIDEMATCLEVIYRLSNSLDAPWTQNKEVYWVRAGKPPRSTSTGDVIVPVFGEAWMVDRTGFRCLSPAKKRNRP